MKALTLHQPWASLIAVGAKQVETRNWAPPGECQGQLLAIHAGVNTQNLHLLQQPVFRDHIPDDMPMGAIVAIATLASVAEMTDEWIECQTDLERLFGHFAPGRFGWSLTNVRPIESVPCRGFQKVWNVPAEVLQRVRF